MAHRVFVLREGRIVHTGCKDSAFNRQDLVTLSELYQSRDVWLHNGFNLLKNCNWMKVNFIYNISGYQLRKVKIFVVNSEEIPQLLQMMELTGAI